MSVKYMPQAAKVTKANFKQIQGSKYAMTCGWVKISNLKGSRGFKKKTVIYFVVIAN